MNHTSITCRIDELSEKVLPLLKGRVYHVTSREGYTGIKVSGMIKANPNGSLPSPWGKGDRDSVMFCRRKNYVPLFDLRTAADIAFANTQKYICPFSNGCKNPVFLILSPDSYSNVITENTVDVPLYGHRVPRIECWYPGTVPLEAIEQVIETTVKPAKKKCIEGFADLGLYCQGLLEVEESSLPECFKSCPRNPGNEKSS